ncbi:MAG: hypothetical protein KDK11_00580 [Maritimibacter sp.]|nr:hypothetical protein [Maritimibacter sp.]
MKNHKLVQQIDAVLASHATWHQEMVIEIKHARKDVTREQLTQNGRRCFFRHWLEGDTIDDTTRKTEPYSVVSWLHGECHKLMDEIVTLVRDGRKPEAIALLDGHCNGLHGTLERALMAWREQVTARKTVPLYAS